MSLNYRIILSVTLVLAVFISLTALALERAFINSSESALRDTLTSQLYALMAAAEVENNAVTMPSKIGRASCRERVSRAVLFPARAGSLKNKYEYY